jgi:hypothetical protein
MKPRTAIAAITIIVVAALVTYRLVTGPWVLTVVSSQLWMTTIGGFHSYEECVKAVPAYQGASTLRGGDPCSLWLWPFDPPRLTRPHIPKNPWRITATHPDGQSTAFGLYASKEACEKDMPNREREQHFSAQCEPFDIAKAK